MDPVRVLRLASGLGAQTGRLLIVGCEPAVTGDLENMIDGLSAPVRAAIGHAAELIIALVERILSGEAIGAMGNEFKACSGD